MIPGTKQQGQPERSTQAPEGTPTGTEGARPTHAAFEEAVGDALICVDGMGRFLHVGPCHLTQNTDRVGATDPLSQERDGSLGMGSV